MESNVNYTLVGLFILILGTILLAGGFWLSSEKSIKLYNSYLIYLNDSVSGLSVQSPVKYNGLDVGYIRSIALDKNNPQQVKILVNIERSIPITQDTVAAIMSFGVTGMGYIGLRTTSNSTKRLEETSGELFPVIKAESSLMTQLDATLREVSSNLTSVTKNIDALVNVNNQKAIAQFLNNINELSSLLVRNSTAIDSSITNASHVLGNMSVVSDQLPHIVTQLNSAHDEVMNMSKTLKKTSNEVDVTMRDAQVAIRTLSEQALPNVMETFANINAAAQKMNMLSTQLNRNPSMLIKGRQALPLGPGEK